MGGCKCKNRCYRESFKKKYDLKKALGKAYEKIRPVKKDIKQYLDGYHFCSQCYIYIRNLKDLYCPCCGGKTRVSRINVRGRLILERYKYGKKHKTRLNSKEDILKNKDKLEAILKS